MTAPTPAESEQIDALVGRIVTAFGNAELPANVDWEVHSGNVAIRAGSRFYMLQGDDLVRIDKSDPRGPHFTIVHPDGTHEQNSGVVNG